MSRDDDPLIADLRRWGYAHANRYAYTRHEMSRHVLENARDYAPKSVERALADLVKRDGRSRRTLMATQLGDAGVRVVPAWAADPIRGRNDADKPHDNPEIAVDMGMPDDLRWIDRSLASMARQFPLRAQVVRTEFTVAASQRIKAKMACDAFVEEMAKRLGITPPPAGEGGRPALTSRQYRHELEAALVWFRGASLAAA